MKRTIEDWLNRARADADGAEVYLAAAAAQASGCWEWRLLLAGMAELEGVPRERLVEVANRTLAEAKVERHVHGFLDVANLRARRFDDADGARAALEACVHTFLSPRTDVLGRAAELLGREARARGYEWVLLGNGFVTVLGDEEGMRRCLRHGRDMARAQANADDLASVAVEWTKSVGRDAGEALLREAEALASNGSANAWTLANSWRALDDHDGVRRVLDAALARAATCDDALHVVRAWSSHQRNDEALVALGHAEQLAASADDWLAVGEAAFDATLDTARIQRALERAEAKAGDRAERARISGAYKSWLGDDAAAARLGPRGVGPGTLRRRVRALEGWPSSASDLFDWLRARATPALLTRIAGADYGTDADKHLSALSDICETGLVPRTLQWVPHEVLALTRWATGERVDHLERALCCTILCLAPSELDELVTNGAILAESCLALGAEARAHAEAFFVWLAETDRTDDETDDGSDQDASVALLLLFVVRAAIAPGDARLAALASLLDDRQGYDPANLRSWIGDSMAAELWSELVAGVLVPHRASHPPIAQVLAGLGR